MNITPPKCLRWLLGVLTVTLLTLPSVVAAQNESLYSTIDNYLQTQTKGLPGTVSHSIGRLDTRTQLSPCDAFEPFQPTGSRLWGKTTVGVRCLGPSAWTVYVPVQVRVSGNYLVAARTMPAGHVLGIDDIVARNGDLGTLPPNIVIDDRQAVGKTVKFGIAAGQALRGDQLIAPIVVQQGQNVKTIANGAGFSVSSEGRALNNATEGQRVQVRTTSGQTVSGIARANGVVEISY